MLDVKSRASRLVLAELTGLPLAVLSEYRPTLTELDAIDDGGADCQVCDTEAAAVEVQWYGRTRDGEPVTGACCRSCVGQALAHGDVDPYEPVELEHLPLVPKAGR